LFIDNSTATSSVERAVSEMINLGASYGSNPERAFMLMQNAVDESQAGGCNEGLIRADAGLALIGVSDEREQSFDGYLTYVSSMQSLKADPSTVVFFGIGGDYPDGCDDAEAYTGMYEATVETGGELYSICTNDWDSMMNDLGESVSAVGSVGANGRFPLQDVPIEETLEVQVNGSTVTSGWVYDAGSNAVEFDAVDAPAVGATVDVAYALKSDCDG
jgi:hypothetical protein